MKRNYIFKMDLLILAILSRKDCYGYEIASKISEESEDSIQLKEGVMYPILHRLMENDLITSYDMIVGKKIRVYYHIEKKGLDEFEFLKNDFETKFKFIQSIIDRKDME